MAFLVRCPGRLDECGALKRVDPAPGADGANVTCPRCLFSFAAVLGKNGPIVLLGVHWTPTAPERWQLSIAA
jgi:hypothetical protein